MQQQTPISPWQAWSLEIQQKVTAQQEQIENLENQVAALCDKLKQFEVRPTYHIDKIEYKFDQLKVEKLDGTLNIGMTAPGGGGNPFPDNIEQLSVPSQQSYPSAGPTTTPTSGPYNDIQSKMNQYLDNRAEQKLLTYEKELGIPLDPYHRRIVIEDIRKQVPSRIQYYMQRSDDPNGQQASYEGEDLIDFVLNKTTRDTDAALLAYMRQLQNGNQQ